LKIEFGAVECAPLPFDDENVLRPGEAVRKRGPVGGHPTLRPWHRLIDIPARRIRKILRESDANQHDRCTRRAEPLGKSPALCEHVVAGARRERRADNPLLKIDQNERGRAGIKIGHIGTSHGLRRVY